MARWLKTLSLFLLLLVLGCEEDATPDYAADLIGIYQVTMLDVDGTTYDLTGNPMEIAQLIEITREVLVFYSNDQTLCSDEFEADSIGIERFTAGSILLDDDTFLEYDLSGGQLHLTDVADEVVMSSYSLAFPPLSWEDPEALNNDAYEPNDTNLDATPITVGPEVQDHYMGACGDFDFFVFSAAEGESYVIETETGDASLLDLYLTLYSDLGDYIDSADDQDGLNLNPQLIWTCETSGDYYFVLESYYFEEGGFYTVSVEAQPENTLGMKPGIIKPRGLQRQEPQPRFVHHREPIR